MNYLTNKRFNKGYTLVEMLIVLFLIAIIVGLTIAAFSKYLQQYRLGNSTRKLASAISLTRLKAVSTNMKYTFTLRTDVSPHEYSATGTNDIDNSGTLEPWEDVSGSGVVDVDSLWGLTQTISNADTPSVDHQGISTLPKGEAMSEAMDNGQVLTIVFDGRGMRTTMQAGGTDKQYILLQNAGYTQAINVSDTGFVRLYRSVDPGWTELH